jgi:hypothetical protein
MKTSKGKASDKPQKTSEAGKTVKSRKVTISKFEPGEEEIRAKAREIYYDRISHGEQGNAESDWHKAKEFLRGNNKN